MHKRMQEIVKSRMNFHDSSKTKKENANLIAFSFFCDRDRIQTCNRLIRSQLLYSVELRDPIICKFSVTATGFKPVTG